MQFSEGEQFPLSAFVNCAPDPLKIRETYTRFPTTSRTRNNTLFVRYFIFGEK